MQEVFITAALVAGLCLGKVLLELAFHANCCNARTGPGGPFGSVLACWHKKRGCEEGHETGAAEEPGEDRERTAGAFGAKL